MKTDREYAMEIARKLNGFQEAFDGAMAMAEIKNKQIKQILSALSENTGDPHRMYDELWDNAKPLDSDISKMVNDNFWELV